jgi:hypothetical protein
MLTLVIDGVRLHRQQPPAPVKINGPKGVINIYVR